MRRAYPGKVNAARTQGRAEVLPRRGATRRLLALVVDLRGTGRSRVRCRRAIRGPP